MFIYNKTLRKLRLAQGIPQDQMIPGKNRSHLSRLETGTTEIKIDTLQTLCNTLGVTMTEFVSLCESQNILNELLIEFRAVARNLEDTEKKEKFLEKFNKFYHKKNDQLTRIESNFKNSVRSAFSSHWKEISPLSSKEINDLYKQLINTGYYGQYDYMLALNLAKRFSKDQMKNIIDKMYPLSDLTSRNDLTKQYSNLLMTNAISFFINEMDYDLALNYISETQKHMNINDSYYLHLNLLYHKNLALTLKTNQSIYIEKTRTVLNIIYDIGDISTANTLETELNNLIHYPDYYKRTNTVAELPAST